MTRNRSAVSAVLLSLAAAFGSSCSGGGSDTAPAPQGTLTIAITDAASDELAAFGVRITSVVLTRASGAEVGVLASPADVDLVTLTETSQVLHIASIPLGYYTAATVTIDFTNARCWLIGESNPAQILDSDGAVITGPMTFPIDVQGLLLGVAGRHKILELDFDLDQSVTVDAGANSVTMEPSFVMRVDHTDPKELFLPGTVASADTASGTFAFELRTLQGELLSTVDVATVETTVFQVNGVPSIGATGLAQLEAQPTGTWVQVYGAVHPEEARIDAHYVEAGTGTYNGGTDIVQGHVVGRVGGAGADAIFTVLGRSQDADHDSFLFNTEFTVDTSFADTKVVPRGVAQPFDCDDINVGQQVRIFGTLSGTSLDASGASAVVRLQPTRVLGYATGPVTSGDLTVDVSRIDLRPQERFTWSEGGTSPVDPDALVASVGNLGDGLGIEAGSAVVVRGLFTAVDHDQQDFGALSLINRDLAPSLMVVRDRAGGLTLTPTVGPTELELAIAGAPGLGEAAVVDKGFVGALPLPTDPVPTIVPATGFTLFAIRDRDTGQIAVHFDFADFAADLDARLLASAVIYNLGALGVYDAPTNTITASLVSTIVD